MTYAGDLVVHDADAHLMETPDWLVEHADPAFRDRIAPLTFGGMVDTVTAMIAQQRSSAVDAARFAGHETDLFTVKNWACYGSFDPTERSRVLDHLGFRSQLVFSTFSHRVLLKHPVAEPHISFDPDVHYATVRAHNRGMTEFCADDDRLLPVGWVSIHDPERALLELDFALAAGCAAIEVPSHPVGPLSPTHVDLLPFYARLEEANVPLIFHIGGGGPLVDPVFDNNGHTYENRFYEGEPARPALIFLGMPRPIEMALGALVFDRIFEQFPRLRCGVIENGATWFPTLLERLDIALRSFGRKEEWQGLSLLPSEYLRRQVKVAPFAYEDIGSLVERTGPEPYLFSTDFPHDEGSYDPIAEFESTAGSLTDRDRDLFYRANFEELMGGRAVSPTGPAGAPG